MSSGSERRAPDENFPSDDRGDESLCEMAYTIVMIPREAKYALHPEPERHLRIRVMAAEHQDQGMNEDQAIGQRRQRKAPRGRKKQRRGDEDRKDFENPRRAIGWLETGPDQQRRAGYEQRNGLP